MGTPSDSTSPLGQRECCRATGADVWKTVTHISALQASGYQASVSRFCKSQAVETIASNFNVTSFVTTIWQKVSHHGSILGPLHDARLMPTGHRWPRRALARRVGRD